MQRGWPNPSWTLEHYCYRTQRLIVESRGGSERARGMPIDSDVLKHQEFVIQRLYDPYREFKCVESKPLLFYSIRFFLFSFFFLLLLPSILYRAVLEIARTQIYPSRRERGRKHIAREDARADWKSRGPFTVHMLPSKALNIIAKF